MERLLKRIERNPRLITSIQDCETQVAPILRRFITNFPDYTDHSIDHSKTVLSYAAYLLNTDIKKLNNDEIYVLIMSGFLHDIGMCPTKKMAKEIKESSAFKESKKSFEDYLRIIHHQLSYSYIMTHWKRLKIINETYAEAISLVSMGHRVVDLLDFEKYLSDFPVKSGSEYVCLPFLAGLLRLADELDITNDRTPELLYNEYLPENTVSKLEWEKHKANYFVNFKDNSIIITSKCFQKDLYYALIKHFKKIENVIDYVQKLIRIIPQNDRELHLRFSNLEKKIKTYGFVPKEIGFSFDLQNTINTFIGNGIYQNKSVSIRECLQNAIDTCRYRKQIDKSIFVPQINVYLSPKQLIVSDNGLGMDEFIVKNYFAKLAKSYYQEKAVSEEFEAISQFGIGVFSYFLICDYFRVESKMSNKEPIKFQANKDADSYFHFYDDVRKDSTGTTVTFFLKKEMNLEELINDVKYYFRYVEFPINIFYNQRHELVAAQDFVLDKNKDLKINRRDIDELDSIEIIDCKISTDQYEGVLGIIMKKNKSNIFTPTYIPSDLFHRYDYDLIEISHKGVFINHLESLLIPFKWTIGKLNLKRKNALDIGRYHILDIDKVFGFLNDFYIKIFEKIFKNWSKETKKVKAELTRQLLDNYFEYNRFGLNQELLTLFSENLYFTTYHNSKVKYMTFSELFLIEEFIILNKTKPFYSESSYTIEDVTEIYNFFGSRTLILENNDDAASSMFRLLKSWGKSIEIVTTDKHWYVLVKGNRQSKVSFCEEILISKYVGYFHDKPHIASNPKLDTSILFNLDHEIVKYIIQRREHISNNQILYDLFNEFLSLITDFLFTFHNSGIKKPTEEIVIINNTLSKINSKLSTSFMLNPDDFPEWINKEIDWKAVT